MVKALVVLVVVAGVLPQAHADGIVLESWVKQRSNDADRLLSPVLDELAKRRFVAGPEAVGRQFETKVSRPTASLTMPPDFVERVERGHSAWISGKFDDAIQILTPLVDAAHANPALLIQNQQLRERLQRALIAIALAEHRRGDPATMRTMFAEIVRSYPQAELPRSIYGPEASQQFEAVRKQVAAQPKGRLTIDGDPTMAVFINERFERVGGIKNLELPPGEYRIVGQVGDRTSRIYRVEVEAEHDATVAIDVAFDAAVHSSPQWSGLVFDSVPAKKQFESKYAVRFARATGGNAVVVLTMEIIDSKRTLVGALLNMETGRDIRRASITLDPDPPESRLRQLGRFLAGESDVKGLEAVVMDRPLAAVATPDARDDGAPSRGIGPWPLVTGGVALAAFAVGGALHYYNGKCTTAERPGIPCEEEYKFAGPGWAAIGAGAALTGVTVYLVVRSREPASKMAVIPSRDGVMAVLSGAF